MSKRILPARDFFRPALARPVLSHRMALSFAARARGETLSAVIGRAVSETLGLREAAA